MVWSPVRKVLVCCGVLGAVFTPMLAQVAGIWEPMSSTASAITGEVSIFNSRLMIGRFPFTIATIRNVDQNEAMAVFDGAGPGSGVLYRLNIQGTQKFSHKNTLCGSSDVQWMLAYATAEKKPVLSLAFFSGSKAPELKAEVIANSTDLCGTFSYSR